MKCGANRNLIRNGGRLWSCRNSRRSVSYVARTLAVFRKGLAFSSNEECPVYTYTSIKVYYRTMNELPPRADAVDTVLSRDGEASTLSSCNLPSIAFSLYIHWCHGTCRYG